MHSDGAGLFLNVRKSSMTFIIRKRRGGRMFVTTLGKHPAVTLKQARVIAAEMALEGTPSAMTVKELVAKYQKKVIEVKHKRPHFAEGYWRRAVLPVLGATKVSDVRPYDIAQMVEQYAEHGSRTADQLRSNVRGLFGYAVELGLISTNPVAEITARVAGYQYQPRERVLTDIEIRQLWREPKPNARVLRFLLLTGLRISEAQKGVQEGERWIVPAELSKNGSAHWVYLTKTAQAQLPLPKCTATNVQAWLRRWCDNKNISPRYTPHDMRRTAATRMAEHGVEHFIVERVLNHTLQGVLRIYNKAEYAPERESAAVKLEQHILGLLKTGNEL